MAVQEQYQAISLEAAADYSTTGQYLFMDVDTNGRAVKVASAGAYAIGILQNKPEQYAAASVAYAGVAKVEAGTGGFDASDILQSDANGKAVIASDEDYCIAVALETVDAGELGAVLLVSKNIRNDAA